MNGRVSSADEVAAAVRDVRASGVRFLVADVASAALDRVLAVAEASDMLVFNAGAPDDRFRNEDCRPFLLHTLPSRAMLADALAQYLVKKDWTQWFLVVGERPEDRLYAAALRRAAGRFGGSIVAEKTWVATHEEGARTDQEEVAVFYAGRPLRRAAGRRRSGRLRRRAALPDVGSAPRRRHPGSHADRLASDARAVGGGAAAVALPARRTGRWMTSRDYAAWTAVRIVGEAATRSRSADFAALARTIRDDDFEVAAFKGRKLSFRAWDGQLRQPIPVAWARSLVTMSPHDGFLHPRTELDTLGYDAPESGCRMLTETEPPSLVR